MQRKGTVIAAVATATMFLIGAVATGLIATAGDSDERDTGDDSATAADPTDVTVDYLSLLIKGNCAQAKAMMSSTAAPVACRYLRPPDGVKIRLGNPIETDVREDRATVTIALRIVESHESNGRPRRKTVSYQLVREDDDWKIAGPNASNGDETSRTKSAAAHVRPTTAPVGSQVEHTTQIAAASDGTLRWLALGDSYSSGEGTRAAAGDCQRSPTSYAPVAHQLLEGSGSDVRFDNPELLACTGARINGNPDSIDLVEQLDAAGKRYDLITLTIGGNDVGFAGIIKQCVMWACAAESDLERDVDAVGSNLSHIYRRLVDEHLAPGGRIIVLGYPRLFEDSETWPIRRRTGTRRHKCMNVNNVDADMLGRVSDRLNNVIRNGTAQYADVAFLPVARAFNGHKLCTSVPGHKPWINGIDVVTRRMENWFHPNANGHKAEARLLARRIKRIHWPAPMPKERDGETCTRQPDGDVICRAD